MRLVVVVMVLFVCLGCSKKDETLESVPLVANHGGYRVWFEPEPWPVVPMKRTTFRVRVEPSLGTDKLLMQLAMPGMYMGQNMVVLKKTSEGVYEGTGVVVRCPTGRTLWRATITARGFGPVRFDFHVRR